MRPQQQRSISGLQSPTMALQSSVIPASTPTATTQIDMSEMMNLMMTMMIMVMMMKMMAGAMTSTTENV